MNYPNGKKYQRPSVLGNTPIQSKRTNSTFSNRGMKLEKLIEESNAFYLTHNRAIIHKKPTPLQIVQVDYPKRSAAVVREAYFKQPSTTDFNGVYRGRYIDFEAKETNNKTSFPLKNFHPHQIEHMRNCAGHGGICFVIIRFNLYNVQYVLPVEHLFPWWDEMETGRKSIPLAVVEAHGEKLETGAFPALDYLNAVDAIYFRETESLKE
ncbi:Holliday junction resolvase RecU [Exiguobacterium flavidum]|uniref:Holliday junction resolvase RecU n=1 Tax=Exiguobacterium flavidum TaxID=2184695 RepID=UPI000DF84610|nr:Holliday junction resolvase RecU [Exiguobacterium flavidum]